MKCDMKSKFAVGVSSACEGIRLVLETLGIEAGDEIITTPWSMCASATAILHWNAIPVFADNQKSQNANLITSNQHKILIGFQLKIVHD